MRNWMKLTIVGSVVTIAMTMTALVFLQAGATTTKPGTSLVSPETADIDASSAGSSSDRGNVSGGNGATGNVSTGNGSNNGSTSNPTGNGSTGNGAGNGSTGQGNPQTGNPPQTPPTTMVGPPVGGGHGPINDPLPPIDVADPGPIVRDHRGDNAGGGGVTVTPTPVVRDHRGEPIVRDHRGEAGGQSCVNVPFVGTVCSPF